MKANKLGKMTEANLIKWIKSSEFSYLLRDRMGLEWRYDYDCCFSRGTVLLLRGFGNDWYYKAVTIHTTGTIPDNDIQEFEFAECYEVLQGGEVTREMVQTTIDWGMK